MWTAALVLPDGNNDVNRVNTNTLAFAIYIQNSDGLSATMLDAHIITIDSLEQITGFDFFSNVDTTIQAVIEARQHTVSGLTNVQNTYNNTTVTEMFACEQLVIPTGYSFEAGAQLRAYISPDCNEGAATRRGVASAPVAPEEAPLQQTTANEVQAGMAIYPNPTSGTLYLNFYQPHKGQVNVKLFDMGGMHNTTLIEQQMVKSGQHTLKADLSHVPEGIYLVRLSSQGGATYIERVIKIAHPPN